MEQATYDLYRRLAEIEHTQDWNLWLSDSLSKYRLKIVQPKTITYYISG